MIILTIVSIDILIISRRASNDQMISNMLNHESDRFIPQRNFAKYYIPDASPTPKASFDTNYAQMIKRRLFEDINKTTSNASVHIPDEFQYKSQASSCASQQLQPNVESPVKVLDIPKYRDDFYLNTVDWSKKGPLAVALDSECFLYTPDNLLELAKTPSSAYISGLKMEDSILAVGLSNGVIEIYDIDKNCLVRTLRNHTNRVSSFTFMDNLLVSGSKDRSILVHDLRIFQNVIKEYHDHKGEVCSLKRKNEFQTVFASGSSDGSAIVWDLKYGKTNHFKGHKGAVKALDWCPWKNGMLATGGGNNTQKHIKIWSTSSNKMVASQAIEHQISGLVWNAEMKMLITSHGFSKNQIAFWGVESQQKGLKLNRLRGWKAHEKRVLNMLQSHDGNYLCTVGADEVLKFWCMRTSQSNPFHRGSSPSKEDEFMRI